ncbi:MAG: hypothetical protein ACYC7E_04210 [Armatimonadota bacterium]
MLLRIVLTLLCVVVSSPLFAADPLAGAPPKPSVLVINGRSPSPHVNGDFAYLQQLHGRGFQIDMLYLNERPPRPITLELLKQYNCLIVMDLPCEEERKNENWTIVTWSPKTPPYKKEMQAMLDAYLKEGGGIFFLPNLHDTGLKVMKKYESYLEPLGARLPYEMVQDQATITRHPRNTMNFIYTANIAQSPVSEGVKGMWFPVEPMSYWSLHSSPLLVSKDWIEVVRGSNTSFTIAPPIPYKLDQEEESYFKIMTRRPDMKTPPTLYAIRDLGANGRLALTAVFPIYTLYGGTRWIHDGATLNKGLAGRPSDFGKLFENTLRWLCEPSLASGKLGGYVQDAKQLLPPNLRKKPDEYFPEFDSYQNPTAPGNVYRGLIGARTRYSSGQGTVEDYATAAQAAGLDFIVFLEEFSKLTEGNYRKLEADCKKLSTDTLLLIPGFRLQNNINNQIFVYGHGIAWPTKTQVVGPNGDELRTQCFDKDGNLALSDEDAKNWIWPLTGMGGKNLGYYHFSTGQGMPVRDLRLYGILAVMTYKNGKLIEDVTPDYRALMMDGNPPLACAVDLVHSPQELARAMAEKHYLTHVAANNLKDLPIAMTYGHQYGRANVYPSSGPQIKSWAGTQRVLTYAGEPFVPARYRIRPLCWVTSDAGLKEIVIYCDTKPYRRFLLNGAKEFKQSFEWAFDRQRILTLEVTDMSGRRAVSAGFEYWCDANFNTWCSDRQNGELWHGALTIPGPRLPALSVGPTWDGGPPPPASAIYSVHPGIYIKSGVGEGMVPGMWTRLMEGDMWATCIDDSVANVAAFGNHNYAPGVVAHAYHTLGPILPSDYMTFTVRRTQYLQRPAGPSIDSHAMWPERVGGNLALIEGSMTFKKDTPVAVMNFAWAQLHNFPKDGSNIPLYAIRRNNDSAPICGPQESVYQRNVGIPPALGAGTGGEYTIDPGGYLAIMPTGEGIASALFNVGDGPITSLPWGAVNFGLPVRGRAFKAGDTLSWRYLVVMDGLDQSVHNLHRFERLREYYGLDGKHTSGLTVQRGTLLSHFGVVDLAAEGGIVEFTVPAPDFPLQLPLGLRFSGLNPKWALGQLQLSGYSQGYYSKGANVYRNLGIDDRDMAYLAIYPDNVKQSHSIVGHPVQCDNPRLIIEVSQLNTKPAEYHVAVNNPTDAPIKTTLKKCMDLPGFIFPDTPIDVPAGGYVVVKEK